MIQENQNLAPHASPLSYIASRALALLRGIQIKRRERSLRVCETLPLGEKRFLAVVECERQRFLLAVTGQSISLLQKLQPEENRASGPEESPCP